MVKGGAGCGGGLGQRLDRTVGCGRGLGHRWGRAAGCDWERGGRGERGPLFHGHMYGREIFSLLDVREELSVLCFQSEHRD